MIDHMDPRAVEKYILFYSAKVMRRLQAAKAYIFQKDDVVQELWIAWCIARDTYEPATGVPFIAYLKRGMQQHINRCIEKHVERCPHVTYALSLDCPTGEDGTGSLGDLIASNLHTVEQVEESLTARSIMAKMSPKTRIFFELLMDTPEELSREVMAEKAKSEYGRKMGLRTASSHSVTKAMIFDLLDYSRDDRREVLADIHAIGEANA